ncbi:MAG: hypothetical protein ACFBSD_05405 [Paracoccaceae bacterium]
MRDLRARLVRSSPWVEPAIAGGLALVLGIWAVGLLAGGVLFGAVPGLGAAFAGLWAVSSLRALKLSRAMGAAGGPGVVEIREGRIAYFAPGDGGGAVGLDALEAVEIEAPARGTGPLPSIGFQGVRWRLEAGDGRVLEIPGAALGAEGIAPTLEALPGFDAATALAAVGRAGRSRVWNRPRGRISSPD